MADEIRDPYESEASLCAGVTDDASLDNTILRVDPATKRLKVDATTAFPAASVGSGAKATALRITPANENLNGGLKATALTVTPASENLGGAASTASLSVTPSTTNLDIGAKSAAMRVAPANDITDGTYIGDIKFGEKLPAGDQNIGDVDIASPIGTSAAASSVSTTPATENLDIGAKAAAMRTCPASDITDATYIGDIKFAEELPAGTQNIGDVDIASPIGTSAAASSVSTTPATENLDIGAKAAAMRVCPASDITDATYIGDIKFGEKLPAGDQNIGDVDIASPIGTSASASSVSVTPATENLDVGAKAAAMRTCPASDITDGTYIGDIKFGEKLPAGDQNIGDVDIASPIGTSASASSVSVTPATENLDIGAKSAALRVAPANDITDGTYIGDIKFGEKLPAGDQNIGDVDIASPIGTSASASSVSVTPATENLDIGAKSAAMRVAPANDITDGTYIGDIKFGEALPAGTAYLGKLVPETSWIISDSDDNAASQATKAAAGGGVHHYLAGISFGFSAAPAAAKNFVITFAAAAQMTIPLAGVGPVCIAFNPPLDVGDNALLQLDLQASGAGGTVSYMAGWGFTK